MYYTQFHMWLSRRSQVLCLPACDADKARLRWHFEAHEAEQVAARQQARDVSAPLPGFVAPCHCRPSSSSSGPAWPCGGAVSPSLLGARLREQAESPGNRAVTHQVAEEWRELMQPGRLQILPIAVPIRLLGGITCSCRLGCAWRRLRLKSHLKFPHDHLHDERHLHLGEESPRAAVRAATERQSGNTGHNGGAVADGQGGAVGVEAPGIGGVQRGIVVRDKGADGDEAALGKTNLEKEQVGRGDTGACCWRRSQPSLTLMVDKEGSRHIEVPPSLAAHLAPGAQAQADVRRSDAQVDAVHTQPDSLRYTTADGRLAVSRETEGGTRN